VKKTDVHTPSAHVGRYAGKTFVLGVTGSIAAYKAVSLCRRLKAEGAQVHVVMTRAAERFVGPLTFEVISGNSVATGLFVSGNEMAHLNLAEIADAILVAPASAHCLGKMAHGLADDLLSTLVLAAECPLLLVPAMDGGMWDHPAVRENVRILRARGVCVMESDTGPLASGRIGKGRLPDEETILAAFSSALSPQKDFQGRRILVTAGPTQESLDPIRYISNRSTGKMGWAIAEVARDRGGDVILIAGPTGLAPVTNVTWVPVVTSEEMHKAVTTRFADADILIMAAAVADFRPARKAPGKVAKGQGRFVLDLEPTPDILGDLAERRSGQIVVGFAAETGDLLARARRKLTGKNLDLIVANDVTEPGAGFGTETNRVTLLDRAGGCKALPLLSKRDVAHRILDAVRRLTTAGRPRP